MRKILDHQIWKIIYFAVIGLCLMIAIYAIFEYIGIRITYTHNNEYFIKNNLEKVNFKIMYDSFNFIHLFSIPLLSIVLKAKYSIKLLFVLLWFPLFFSLPKIIFLFFN
jgi:hypothetical protein